MTAPAGLRRTAEVARDYQRQQDQLASLTAKVAGQMWAEVDPARIALSWRAQLPEVTAVVSGAQLGAARQADAYTNEVLAAQDLDTAAQGAVNPPAFAGTASDGRGLMSLLTNPVFLTLATIADIHDVGRAMGAGRRNLEALVQTQVLDAGRLASHTSLVAHPSVTGYVRVSDGNPCKRCLPIVGRFYLWNKGFDRHPKCACEHLACTPETARQFPSPQDVYDRMTPAQRKAAGFTAGDRAALAEGADIGQVVNADRFLRTADGYVSSKYKVAGRQFTTEGTTPLGFARSRLGPGVPRITPDQILKDATSREDAIRLLHRHGYLIDMPPVPVPPLVGPLPPVRPLPSRFPQPSGRPLPSGRPQPSGRPLPSGRPQPTRFPLPTRLESLPSGLPARAIPAPMAEIRPVLADAPTIAEVRLAFWAETGRIRGARLAPDDIDFTGSIQTAREHAEGILRGLERFPRARLRGVFTETPTGPRYASSSGPDIYFSTRWTNPASREKYLSALEADVADGWHVAGSASPVAIALHEFGHVIDLWTLGRAARMDIRALLRRRALERAVDIDDLIRVDISGYATRNLDELVAEAFTDVVVNGSRASALSREVMDLVEAQYRAGVTAAGARAFAPTGPARTLPQLRAEVTARGITVPAGLRKPDLQRLVDDLESGVTPARARETAVRTILTEREGVAAALTEAAEMAGNAGSARALQALGRQLRGRLSADQAKTAAALLRALDAGNLAEVRAALPVVARSAKVKPVGAAQDIARMDRDRMLVVGADDVPAGGAVRVLRPGFETTFEGSTTLLSRASVVRATPEQAARLTPVKAAKKAAPRTAAFDARAKTAAHGDEAMRAAPAGLDRAVTGLTDAQAQAVREYRSVTGFRRINGALRSGQLDVESGAIRALDEAMAASRLSRDVVVYRGLRYGPDVDFGRSFADDLTGAEFGDLAYVSTARTVDQAENIARHGFGRDSDPRDPLVMRILGPRGTGAIEASDTELVLARGLRFRVVADRGVVDGMRRIDVEVVPTSRAVKAVKAAPAKRAATAAQDLTGSRGLLQVPVVREVQIENRIRQIAAPNEPVLLAEIRAALPGVSDDELARIIARMGREPGVATQNWEANALFGGTLRGLSEAQIQAAGLRVGNQIIHAVYFANPVLRPLPAAAKAVKKAAAPKLPPTPDKMSIPALKAELQRTIDAAAPSVRFDLTGVPKSTLVTWTTRARAMAVPDAEEIGRWRQVIVDRHRHVAELLAEADELIANGAPAAGMGARARARLARIEKAIAGWPHEASVRAVVTAMSTGNPASIRRAIAAAKRKVGLEQVGPDAGKIGRFDRSTMSPISGARIADDAAVVVVRPGYAVDVGGERVVLMRPVVEPAPLPPRVFDLKAAMEREGVTQAEITRIRKLMGTGSGRRAPAILVSDTDIDAARLAVRFEDDKVVKEFARRHRAIYNHLAQERSIEAEWRAASIGSWGRGLSLADARREAAATLQRAVQGQPIVIRRKTEDRLRRALEDGRLKTQFETGTSSGVLDTEIRASFEDMTFGLPRDLPASERPIYGYVSVGGVQPADARLLAVDNYGDIQIVLKDSVRGRTTVSAFDSLDQRGVVRPSPIDDIDWRSADAGLIKYGPDRYDYIEAQIHGGVRWEDVAEVVFVRQPEPATVKALERRGVKWRVLRRAVG